MPVNWVQDVDQQGSATATQLAATTTLESIKSKSGRAFAAVCVKEVSEKQCQTTLHGSELTEVSAIHALFNNVISTCDLHDGGRLCCHTCGKSLAEHWSVLTPCPVNCHCGLTFLSLPRAVIDHVLVRQSLCGRATVVITYATWYSQAIFGVVSRV